MPCGWLRLERNGTAVRIRVGTRGSRLARIQTARVTSRLEAAGHAVETRVLQTAGDRRQDLPFHAVGPPGVFVREIERALAAGEIDAAVHSYKDLPSENPEGLMVAAVPERLDAADCLLLAPGTATGAGPIPAPPSARVGTSSARRAALLRDLRPDLEVRSIRGNLPTRIAKLETEPYDAILLAAAGLERLGDDPQGQDRAAPEPVRFRLDPELFVPAPAQGALAVQVRGDHPARAAIEALDDPTRRREVDTERQLLALVEGGCRVAVGAWCRALDGGRWALTAVLEVDGRLRRAAASGPEGERLAHSVAGRLLAGRNDP